MDRIYFCLPRRVSRTASPRSCKQTHNEHTLNKTIVHPRKFHPLPPRDNTPPVAHFITRYDKQTQSNDNEFPENSRCHMFLSSRNLVNDPIPAHLNPDRRIARHHLPHCNAVAVGPASHCCALREEPSFLRRVVRR